MPRQSDFPIHVDSSCLTDSTDLQRPSKRNESGQTVVHNDVEDLRSEYGGSQMSSQVSHDEHTEALIHAAARAVVASMEQSHYVQEDSVLSMRTEEGYDGGTERTYGDGTEISYEDDAAQHYDSDADHSHHDPYDGSASSQHEDDVFSEGNPRSNRSSMNSCPDVEEEGEEKHTQKDETQYENQSEEQREGRSQISRIPSMASDAYSLLPEPLTITPSPHPHTPSKVMSRPPFRTPSSVRAMQMSSPTPSIFSASPRSSKRPTVSHLGTPGAQNESPSKMRTPTRFKAKENPLVLLHVTVLPLHWPCGDALDSVSGEGLPRELSSVKDSWKSLKEKLGDTVLERGILLPHPQDSYEVLQERLLEALELPVRPRAKILTCGHYVGPDDMGYLSEDGSEHEENAGDAGAREQWCDICGREVQYEEMGMSGRQKRFRVKVYASNGLMRAGAWAAAWREMERVDVEIEPFLSTHLVPLMDSLLAFHAQPSPSSGFNHEEGKPVPEERGIPEEGHEGAQDAARRKELEDERMREIYGHGPSPSVDADDMNRPQRSASRQQYGDTLPELIWEAVKVLMRDKKQIAICILSTLVIILALRPASTTPPATTEAVVPQIAVSRPNIDATIVSTEEIVTESPEQKIENVPVHVVETINVPTTQALADAPVDPLPPVVSANTEPLVTEEQKAVQDVETEPRASMEEAAKIPEVEKEAEAEPDMEIRPTVANPEVLRVEEIVQTA